MCKYYSKIILVFVGWLFLPGAAALAQEGRRDQQVESQSAAVSLQRIAASVERSAEPDPTTQPCPKGEDNRNSDLCAQWKAADAASTGTALTEKTYVLSIFSLVIGFFGSVIAVIAAYYTMLAARASQGALNALVRTEDARISISIPSVSKTPVQNLFIINVLIHNIGRTAAILHTINLGGKEIHFNVKLLPSGPPLDYDSIPELLVIESGCEYVDVIVEYSSIFTGRMKQSVRAIVLDHPSSTNKWGSVKSEHLERVAEA